MRSNQGAPHRTIKGATVKRFHYDDHQQFEPHLTAFVSAYNFGRRLQAFQGLTPFAFIRECWLSRILRGSCREQNALAEQVQPSAAVTLSFEQLQPGDLFFGLAARPRASG